MVTDARTHAYTHARTQKSRPNPSLTFDVMQNFPRWIISMNFDAVTYIPLNKYPKRVQCLLQMQVEQYLCFSLFLYFSGKVFITYSFDSMKDVVHLAKFLRANGFDTMVSEILIPIQNLSSWMSKSFTNDKCMIIIAVSPAYSQDIEESSVDNLNEHSLHTKYIHRQMQSRFISQGSLNFRFIPVLMPNASKEDLPCWLHSTLVFHWPDEPARLMLRLLREEMVQVPPIGRLPAIISVPLNSKFAVNLFFFINHIFWHPSTSLVNSIIREVL
uniref:SEFIR domain-containing protein n=1 Tax=Eptatretus burgeri TaxID=7764 RepID=A0A8C4QHY4_EPTBU